MKMSRKWILVAALVLSVAMASSGTIAYLQDSDSDVNVMTMGSVHIKQHEYERVVNADGTYATDTIDDQTSYVLKDFTQGKPIVPIVGDPSLPGDSPAYAGYDTTTVRMSQVNSYGGMDVFAGKNAQDKFVTVENTGKSPAYVRTLVALEVGNGNAKMLGTSYHTTWTKNNIGVIEIDGNNYSVTEYLYKGASIRHQNGVLPAGDTTYPNLSQVYLKSAATNEDLEAIDGNGNGMLDILVLSQAVQADGFDNAKIALDTAFGEVNEENVQKWFGKDLPILTVSTAAELQAELDKATDGTTIFLSNKITGDVTVTQKPDVKITIDGMGNTFEGSILVDGKSKRYETTGVTIKNIKFDASAISADAFINLGKKGDNNTRYTNNVTVTGCTFNYTGEGDKVAIKSYTGGDWNLTVDGCTVNAGMHSAVQVTNVEKGLTISDCKVYSKNGINLNNTPSLEMSGCEFDTKGYCVRVGVNGSTLNGTFNISDSTLKSAGDDGDAVIIVRGNAAGSTLNLTNTTVTGTEKVSGDAHIIGLN
ncbi:MAG: hypothetical protein IJD39_09395 [Clostridia bacterium]|nr:hypothetical protein [Clostridia bacterium]